MKVRYQDFIGMYDNVYDERFCSHVINEFERIRTTGYCGNRQSAEGIVKTKKQDEFFFLNMNNHVMAEFDGVIPELVFFDGLQRCFEEYVNEYDSLKDFDIKSTSVKLQKTDPGSGYHMWHCEQGNGPNAARCLTYILYLNTLEENCAGETEFLYQRLRIPPKENSLVIWPAAFTHTHRGNVVHGTKSKYIVTGWFYLD